MFNACRDTFHILQMHDCLSQKMKPKMHLGEAPGSAGEKDRLWAETPMFEDMDRPGRKKEDVLYFRKEDEYSHHALVRSSG